jgi:DNA topoisomerase-3
VTKHLFVGPFAFLVSKVGGIKFPLVRKSVFNTAKLSEHHAIIPTTKPAALGEMSAEERKAYFLIAGRYLQALMPDHVYVFTKVLLPVEGIEFQATGHRPLEPGWKEVFVDREAEDGTQEELPPVGDGETAIVRDTTVIECQTKPPARYTDGTLIDDMKTIGKFVTDPLLKRRLKETSGLGTEATRAAILKNLRDRRFIELHGKHLVSTPLGRALIGILEQKLPALIDPGMTAVWETELEEIAQGSKRRETFLDNVRRQVRLGNMWGLSAMGREGS